MSDSPKNLLVGISGFMETEKRRSGIEDILWQVFSDVDHCAVARFMWNDSLVTMDRLIGRIVEQWPEIEVSIVAYSYGGTTAINLIDKLASGRFADTVPIKHLFLIDPVWRPWRKAPSVFSVWGAGTLSVGGNVAHCRVWRQRTTFIRGCKIEMQSAHTTYHEDELNYSHTKIDNSALIKGAIVERMRQ